MAEINPGDTVHVLIAPSTGIANGAEYEVALTDSDAIAWKDERRSHETSERRYVNGRIYRPKQGPH